MILRWTENLFMQYQYQYYINANGDVDTDTVDTDTVNTTITDDPEDTTANIMGDIGNLNDCG